MNRADLKSLLKILPEVEGGESERLQKKIKKELKPISVSSRKAKGRGLQQEVCRRLSERTGIEWGYDNYEIQPRQMGGAGTDVLLIGRAKEAIPFDIECKNVESFSLKPTIDQAKANTTEGRIWLIVHKRKGLDPIAILDLEDFLDIFFEAPD